MPPDAALLRQRITPPDDHGRALAPQLPDRPCGCHCDPYVFGHWHLEGCKQEATR